MIIFQKLIYRDDVKRNPNVLYVFGDNIARKGFGGQAREMRGEPNAIGIATKHSPIAYFSDKDFEDVIEIIDIDFKPLFTHQTSGGIIIIPTDGIGTGLAQLPSRAPKIHAYIQEKFNDLRLLP